MTYKEAEIELPKYLHLIGTEIIEGNKKGKIKDVIIAPSDPTAKHEYIDVNYIVATQNHTKPDIKNIPVDVVILYSYDAFSKISTFYMNASPELIKGND